MSAEFQKRLFEPFSQEDNGARTHYAGTGLGMAISKQYVELRFTARKGVVRLLQ